MIAIGTVQAVVAGALIALILFGGLAALFVGLRARAAAAAEVGDLRALQMLNAVTPAVPMIVRSDGRLEMPRRLADWFGFEAPPAHVSELAAEHGPFASGQGAALASAIRAAQKGARAFRLPLQVMGSQRSLMAVGDRAPIDLNAPGGALVWIFDATELQGEVVRLTGEAARLASAYDALTGLIEAAPVPMWYRGPDLKLAMVNTAYLRAVEVEKAAEVIAGQIELVEDSGLGGPLANAAIARDTDQPQMAALPATIGGARRMLRIHDVPLPDGGTAGYAIDVEELEQARAGVKRFADAQRALLDRLSAGVAQFAADRSLEFCNQPFRRMFAMRPEWLADKPEFDRVIERMRESNRLPEVRDFPNWKAERRGWFNAPDPELEESWHLPGGTHLRVVAQPLPDGGLLLIFEDRTEQVQLASARDTLLRVRTATFDNLFEALGVFAADGRLQLWNNKFRTIWGFEEEMLASHPRVDALAQAGAPKLARPERAELMLALVRSATVDRQQRGGRMAFADGRHFEFTAVPLPDGNALVTMLDISDSRRIEQALRDRNEALEAADRVRTAFVANMSYELRTPLTSIKGFAEMLEAGYAGELSESGTEYANAILESVGRLSSLVDDVLELTEEGGRVKKAPVDVSDTARAAVDAIRPLTEERKVELAIEIQDDAGAVQGDGRRIRQAIEHALRYCAQALPPRRRLLLHVDGTDKAARIIVSDDGPGMNASQVEHAFDRFAPSGGGRSGGSALGIGLPLAKQFVEAHGGVIKLMSEPGEGTLITITLPRA